MNDSESKNEKPKEGRRFSQEQYDMLKRCSDKKDMTEWNEWRKKNKRDDVLLEGAVFERAHLKCANLGILQMIDETTKKRVFGEVHLENANFQQANLESADLQFAHLENANLSWANLRNAAIMDTYLKNAKLWFAHLEKADISHARLQGSECHRANVDGATSLWECKVDRSTNFLGVGLSFAKIDHGTRQLLEYNIRRMNWEDWYKEHSRLKCLVKPFWLMSDYGLSTGRIVFTFFGLALIFANIYYHWGIIAPPGIVDNLLVDRNGVEVQWWLVPLRTLYFSIVTMTTLGFGDMYANARSILGHMLLMLQVILGYVLLGALVTRFAVLFTAGGPAGKFSNEKEKVKYEILSTKSETNSNGQN